MHRPLRIAGMDGYIHPIAIRIVAKSVIVRESRESPIARHLDREFATSRSASPIIRN